MSSYLTISLEDKKTKEKKALCSFSRNHPLYTAIDESLNVPYENDRELTAEDLDIVIADLESTNKKFERQLHIYKDYKTIVDDDTFGSIEFLEESIEENKETINKLYFLDTIVDECKNNYSAFSGVYVRIN